MNLHKISDRDLLDVTKKLSGEERVLLIKILHHLREIDRRKLYSDLGYKSLFEYAVTELKYSEDQAWRRINAMRVLKDLPQFEEKVSEGLLTLSNINMATNLFRAEQKFLGRPIPAQRKHEIMEAVCGKSKREAEVVLTKLSDAPTAFLQPERLRTVDGGAEVQFYAKQELLDKIDLIKGYLAHSVPSIGLADLFELLCDEFIEKRQDKMNRTVVKTASPSDGPSERLRNGNQTAPARESCVREPQRRKAISAPLRRLIWQRDKGTCVKCASKFALEIDHIVPHAYGGRQIESNLRLLCRNCNQREAVKIFGAAKLERAKMSDPYSKR